MTHEKLDSQTRLIFPINIGFRLVLVFVYTSKKMKEQNHPKIKPVRGSKELKVPSNFERTTAIKDCKQFQTNALLFSSAHKQCHNSQLKI